MVQKLRVPFHFPSIEQEEIDEVLDTLKSGWLTTGPRTARFEKEFAEYVCAPYAQAVNSCTAGLHLALAALDIGPGDEVVTSPLTFCATVNVILQTGATPVLADVRSDGNIDPLSIARRLTGRTRAIIPVHLAGEPCDMDEIRAIARNHNLHIIEDCAHAAGSRHRDLPVGSCGGPSEGPASACVFSFYATKNMTTGEGGMVTTQDRKLADRMKILCLHGISKDAWNRYSDEGSWHYQVIESGFKYNMSDIQAAIGIHQLRKLERFIAIRTRYAQIYNQILGGSNEFRIPQPENRSRHSWHLYLLRLNLDRLEIDRSQFIERLRKRGIGASVHFIPIPLHPFFSQYAGRPENQCPLAIEQYRRLVSLPLYPAMTADSVTFVAQTVKDIARSSRRTSARTCVTAI